MNAKCVKCGTLGKSCLSSFPSISRFERACFRFALKTLARNERQSLIFGGFVGLGLVIASQTLLSAFAGSRHAMPSSDLLSAPLILAYFVLFLFLSAASCCTKL